MSSSRIYTAPITAVYPCMGDNVHSIQLHYNRNKKTAEMIIRGTANLYVGLAAWNKAYRAESEFNP